MMLRKIDMKKHVMVKRVCRHDLGDNTLIKPFCELGGELDQKIKWKNIMSYTGGNKRNTIMLVMLVMKIIMIMFLSKLTLEKV